MIYLLIAVQFTRMRFKLLTQHYVFLPEPPAPADDPELPEDPEDYLGNFIRASLLSLEKILL